MARNAEDIATEMDELSKEIDDTNYTFVTGRQEKMRVLSARRDALNIEHTAELAKQCYVTMPVYGWVCFHCGIRCFSVTEARDHFGDLPTSKPACSKEERQELREKVREAFIAVVTGVNPFAPMAYPPADEDAPFINDPDKIQ